MLSLENENKLLDLVIEKDIKGPCNIPKAKFIDLYSLLNKDNIESFIRVSQELHSKYQYMELSLLSQKKTLTTKLADLKDAVETVCHLKRKKEENVHEPLKTKFVLSDNVYASASIEKLDTVFLWLGANVLMEYNLDEAQALLEKNKSHAEASLENLKESLRFIRCQLTTTEVNIARIHNHGVTLRRQDQSGSSAV